MSKLYGVDKNNRPVIMSRLYRETRTRNHYGGAIIESYLANKLIIAPLMNHNLSKISLGNEKISDPKLLYALILTRYQKDLLNFKVQGGRTYGKDIIELAEQINGKYPLDPSIKIYKRSPVAETGTQIFDCQENNIHYPEGDEYFFKILHSEQFKSAFTSYFPEEVYYKTKKFSESQSAYKLMPWYPLIAATKILLDVKTGRYMNEEFTGQYFNSDNRVQSVQKSISQSKKLDIILNYFKTAKISLVNDKMLQITDFAVSVFDENARLIPLVNSPGNRYIGYTVESNKQNLQIKFQCKTDSEVSIFLSCNNVMADNKKLPIQLDYTYLSINGNDIISDRRITVTGDAPAFFKMRVNSNEIYNVVLRWEIYNYSDQEFLNLITTMMTDDVSYNL